MKKLKFNLNTRTYYAIGAIAIAIAFLFAALLPGLSGKIHPLFTSSESGFDKVSVADGATTGFRSYDR